ncbi:MAG: ankyrin repeat domain-containing protein [Akkermansia sp.]
MYRNLFLSALAAAALAGCKPAATPMDTEQREQFESIYTPAESFCDEAAQLIRHYADTQQADFAIRGCSMLHLACMAHDEALVATLIADGADVNADSELATPLACVIRGELRGTGSENDPESDIRLIELLLSHGAELNARMEDNCTALDVALMSHREDLFLYLLDKGASAGRINPLAAAAAMHWVETLRRLVAEQALPPEALAEACSGAHEDDGTREECLRLLLEAGADPNSRLADNTPALMLLAAELSTDEAAPDLPQLLTLLLEKGADATLKAEPPSEWAGLCAADLLTADPELAAELRDQGYTIPEVPLLIREGETLACDIRRAALRRDENKAELLAPFADTLARALQQGSVRGELAAEAICLLAEAAPERAARVVLTLPLWSDLSLWEGDDNLFIIRAIAKDTALRLPAEALLATARMLSQGGKAHEAAAVTELMERSPDADALLTELCEAEDAAIRTAAWTVRLHREGLPDAKSGSVTEWLHRHELNPAAMSASVVEALHLTSLDDFWMGEMDANEQQSLFLYMEDIGQKEVADRYRAMAKVLDNPRELDRLTADSDRWSWDLESAVARFIWDNREAFLQARQPGGETPCDCADPGADDPGADDPE